MATREPGDIELEQCVLELRKKVTETAEAHPDLTYTEFAYAVAQVAGVWARMAVKMERENDT